MSNQELPEGPIPITPQLIDQLRQFGSEKKIEETEETTDLHLTRDEFMQKMLKEQNGQELLDLLEDGEWRICERMGLSKAYFENNIPYIDVPRWNNLVAHLRLVNSV